MRGKCRWGNRVLCYFGHLPAKSLHHCKSGALEAEQSEEKDIGREVVKGSIVVRVLVAAVNALFALVIDDCPYNVVRALFTLLELAP